MTKTPLILLTALLKLDNIVYLAKDINRYYQEFSQYFNIYWLICKDKYNGYGDLSAFFDYINTTDINWQMYDSGQPNQKNYGGALFNDPLTDFINTNNIDNPFVYILDDDNILHPNLLPTLKLYQDQNFNNKEIIVLNCVFDEGYLKPLYNGNINVVSNSGFIDGMNIVDPSAVILRYSIIQKYGMFKSAADYDFTWLLTLIHIELQQNNILTNMDLLYLYNISPIYGTRNAYHNHLNPIKDKQQIDLVKDVDISDLIIDINISARYDKHPTIRTMNIPILSDETKHKIKELIYEEIEKDRS